MLAGEVGAGAEELAVGLADVGVGEGVGVGVGVGVAVGAVEEDCDGDGEGLGDFLTWPGAWLRPWP